MPTVTFNSSGNFTIPDLHGPIFVTVKGGDGGQGGLNSPLTNSPFCDTPFGGVNAGGSGTGSAFDTGYAGGGAAGDGTGGGTNPATSISFVFGQNHYRRGYVIPILVGTGGIGGTGTETGCGGSTIGANGANGFVTITWDATVPRQIVPF